MLKSCTYCHSIHSNKHICHEKKQAIAERQKRYKGTDIDKFRWSKQWRIKREYIRKRDKQLCQICFRNLYNTVYQYTFDGLSVHHAIPLSEDFTKRLDNNNLITVCQYHHEMCESGEIPREEVLRIIQEQEG